MSRIQFLLDDDGNPEFAVLPIAEFNRLKQRDLDVSDIRAALEAEDDEELPWDMVKRLMHGENPLKVWREYRQMTQRRLAERVGVRTGYISQIETGHKKPSLPLAEKMAAVLDITIDDLVAPADDE